MGSTVLLCGGAKIPKTGAEAAAGTARFSESPIRAASLRRRRGLSALRRPGPSRFGDLRGVFGTAVRAIAGAAAACDGLAFLFLPHHPADEQREDAEHHEGDKNRQKIRFQPDKHGILLSETGGPTLFCREGADPRLFRYATAFSESVVASL